MVSTARPDWSGRLDRVQSALRDRSLDALVVSARLNVRYLTGFAGTAGLLVITPARAALVVDRRYALGAREEQRAGAIADLEVVEVDTRYDLTLAAWLTEHELARTGFEAGDVTVAKLQGWQRAAPDLTWVPTERVVEDLRRVKDAWEQDVFRRAARQLDEVAARLPAWIRAGRTEVAVAEDIDAGIRAAGFSGPSFPTIVASGPNSARPHATPGTRALAAGDLVVLDFGGVLDGYCVDLTRMAAVGPVSDAARALYEAVTDAHRAAIDAVRPGVHSSAIDSAARSVLESRGLGQAFLHSTGHGLGLEIHESPRIGRPDGEGAGYGEGAGHIEAGMVFTIEPGAYVEGIGGVRLEDDVLVTTTGCEVLTQAPRALVVA
jgi:Xaa-Pro aminopeptidase